MKTRMTLALAILILLVLSGSRPPCQAPAGKGKTPAGLAATKASAPALPWKTFEPPPSLIVEQSVKGAPQGWRVAYEDRLNILAGVTFYDGPPEEMASLVYDKQATVGKKWVATWMFDPDAPKGIWVEFHFASTTAMLRQQLPKGVTAAEVTFDRDQHIDGYEQIEKIKIR